MHVCMMHIKIILDFCACVNDERIYDAHMDDAYIQDSQCTHDACVHDACTHKLNSRGRIWNFS